MIYNTSVNNKKFHCYTMSLGLVSGFLGFFEGKVSIDVFENVIVEFYDSRPFYSYITLHYY